MIIKPVEIRDQGTCIAAIALRMDAATRIENVYLRRCGYPQDGSSVVLMLLDNQKATNDPYDWPSLGLGQRTMPNAHHYIIDHFDEIPDGGVVDVRVILGEAEKPAEPDIYREAVHG